MCNNHISVNVVSITLSIYPFFVLQKIQLYLQLCFSVFLYSFFKIFLLYFRFWGTCADHAGSLHRYTHGNVVCCLHPPVTYIWHFSMGYPSPTSLPTVVPPLFPHNRPQCCDAALPLSICSHSSTAGYEWEHAVFDFLFLYQYAENDGFQIHPCLFKGHKFILFYGCIVLHGVYVQHFPCPVYCWWAFALLPGLCYCKQCCNEHSCACVLITDWFIVLWIYTQ